MNLKRLRNKATLIVVAGDSHTGDPVGLMPAQGIALEHGHHLQPSKAAKEMYRDWLKLWRLVKQIGRKERRKVVAVLMGDLIDLNRYTVRGITQNVTRLVSAAVRVLEPVEAAVDTIYLIRGTEAHEGEENELLELVAKDVKCQKNEDGTHSWYKLHLRSNGVLGQFQHHPKSNSKLEHTRGSGALREAAQIKQERQRLGLEVPRYAARGHVHHIENSGRHNHPTQVLFCSAWKGHNGYENRGAFSAEHPSAWLVRTQGNDYSVELVQFPQSINTKIDVEEV